MTNRFIVAVAAILSFAGSTIAQAPEAPPPDVPPVTAAPSALSWFLPARFETGGPGQFWATGDYLFTFVRGSNLPALVTTSVPGTPQTSAGILGADGSSTLFGGTVTDGLRAGFRLGAGYWFNPEKTLGIETGFMMTESRSALFSASSNDGTILARPFINANTSVPKAVLVAFPGSSDGSIDVRANSGNFYSFHLDLCETAYDVGWFRLTSLFGYRYYRYDEAIRIGQVIIPTAANIFPFPVGTQIATNDNFNTRNSFNGLDMGFRSQFFWNNFSLEVLTKLAFGRLNRTFIIAGDQTATAPNATTATQTVGVLAASSNSGTLTSSDWRAMPEVGATLNWQIRSNVNVRFGYSFLYMNGVARAADQIDTTVNPNLFPGNTGLGVARPSANRTRSDLWIQAVNLGLQFSY